MFYIKTPKQITKTGRKRILAVGTEVKKLGLDDGDDVIIYIMRPEYELSMDMLIQKQGTSSISSCPRTPISSSPAPYPRPRT